MSLMRIVQNRQVASGVFELEMAAPPEVLQAAPGTFLHIAVDGVFLRRPFSIHYTDPGKKTAAVAYAVRGEGTRRLSETKAGTKLDVLGPLGNGFGLPDGAGRVLLIGGGMGAAPLLQASRFLKGRAVCDAALGFASAPFAFSLERYEACCRSLHVATDDGSLGEAGNACEIAARLIERERPDAVWACGPEGMYRALLGLECLKGIDCRISLEERMGCGVGACLTCSCRIRSGDGWTYRRVCADGPVFALREVVFDA